MKVLVKIRNLLSVSSQEDDTIIIYSKTLNVVFTPNDAGVSVGYYDRRKKTSHSA